MTRSRSAVRSTVRVDAAAHTTPPRAAPSRPARSHPPQSRAESELARSHRLDFFRQFLKAPRELGTCFTSGKALTQALTSGLDLERARRVVELGPGSGPLTQRILDIAPPDVRFFTIESNAGLVEVLRQRFPSVTTYHDDAANIVELCRREGVEPGTVDVVVSSLPFLLFDPPFQDRLLGAIVQALRPGGAFSMVTYRPEWLMPSARAFRRMMQRHFSTVTRAPVVLANMPPANVYRCRK